MKNLTIIVWALTIAVVSASLTHNAYIPVRRTSGLLLPCRGSMISPTWILTAASCFDDRGTLPIEVYLGYTEKKKYAFQMKANEIIIHQNYTKVPLLNDIALIKIRKDFKPNRYAFMINLPQNGTDLYVDRNVIVSRYAESEINSFTVLDNAACEAKLNVQIADSNLCIINLNSCTGNFDRGGSVFLPEENMLIAVISHGPDTRCKANTPSVATRVSSYLSWIKDETGISIAE